MSLTSPFKNMFRDNLQGGAKRKKVKQLLTRQMVRLRSDRKAVKMSDYRHPLLRILILASLV